jgi:hypothetical protein
MKPPRKPRKPRVYKAPVPPEERWSTAVRSKALSEGIPESEHAALHEWLKAQPGYRTAYDAQVYAKWDTPLAFLFIGYGHARRSRPTNPVPQPEQPHEI